MSSPDNLRITAENLIASCSNSNPNAVTTPNLEISHSQSINTIQSLRPEYVISQDILAGHRHEGNMSDVRRFFCLFVTFDLLFTSLMWLICVMLSGDNIASALSKQIVHYNIHSSLFDIVLAAICRFTVLLLFYALLYINHWIIISISTATTCAFLIAKVFVFNWADSPQPVFQVLLILASFIIAWSEAWFLDFRVIPQELHARRYFVTSTEAERAPLIRSYVQGLPSMYTESVGNFYSPLGSADVSIHGAESGNCSQNKYPPVRLSLEKEEELKIKSTEVLQEAWSKLNDPNWKLEKRHANGDTVESLNWQHVGKVYKLTAIVDTSPRCLLDELFYRVENIPNWNPSLLESHKIQIIDEYTDISYQISADACSGIVTSRDFVTLRHWALIEGCYVSSYVATEHASVPKSEKYIRAENGIGCWTMRPIPGQANKCKLQWLLNTNLKGWIPHYILDNAFIGMMFDYIQHLRRYIQKMENSGNRL